MIKEEFLNDNTLVKHYSDLNVMLRQVETGAVYAEPIDIYPCPYTYEETEEKIEIEEAPAKEQADDSETVFIKYRDGYVNGELTLSDIKQAFADDLLNLDQYIEISNMEVKTEATEKVSEEKE